MKDVSLWTPKNVHTQTSNYGQQCKPDWGVNSSAKYSNRNCESTKSFKTSFKTFTNVLCVLTKTKHNDRCQFMTSFSLSRSLLNLPWQSEKKQKEGVVGGERKGPEVCLGGRWLSVAVNRQLFDAIVLAQACLSRSVTAIKDSLTAKTGAGVETQANPHILSFTPGI